MFVPLIVLAVGLVMLSCEAARPGRSWPKVAGWWARAVALNSFEVLIIVVSGLAWDRWMVRHRPWSADALGVTGGAFAGYFALTFVYYWWHRFRHSSLFLWRWVHQMHHSPQRIEVITSFYKHPIEIISNGVLSSAVLYLTVGVNVKAATYAMLLSGLAELFYHWNVRTPYWVGYIFQRPESHCIHHQEGLHSYNYADLPLWDMLFGTFRNPRKWDARCGFGPEGELRFQEMLAGVDVSTPKPAEGKA
jgi:sterol desaturase/sphingolipid hydroxylase (fatty acid hydroxylase superfamily)